MYYAFGMQWEGVWMYDEPVDAEENRYRYNGKEYSKGSRLSDYGFRYYSSDIGRWNAVDPLADHPNQVNMSPYAYAWNNPVLLTDPDGRCPICPFIVIGFLLLEAHPASTPGGHDDHVKIQQAQNDYAMNQLFALIPGTKQTKVSQVVAAQIKNEVKGEVKAEVIKRVSPRKSTKEQVTQNQPRDRDGRMIDPNTKEPLKPGEIDLGHKPGNEWRTRAQMHKENGSSRKEVIEAENNPSLYQWEDRSSNRSRKFELKTGNYSTTKE